MIQSKINHKQLKTLALFESKHDKKSSDEYLEIDLDDLEAFGTYRHGDEFLKIPGTLIKGKTVMEWLSINDESYWWIIAPLIHGKYKEAFLFVEKFINLIEKNSVSSIFLYGSYNKIEIIKKICTKKNITLKIDRKKYFLFTMKQYIKNIVKKYRYKKITKEKIRKRINFYNSTNRKKDPIKGSIIVTSPGIFRRPTLTVEGDFKEQEFFIQPILDSLYKKNTPILCFDLDYTLKGDLGVLQKRINTEFNWVPIEFLLDNKSSRKNVNKSISTLQKRMDFLIKNGLSKKFSYQNISLWEYVKPIFDDIFLEPNLPTYMHLIKNLEDFFTKIKPQLIIQIYEAGPYAKAFQIAAKKLGITTIGLQHAQIASDYPDYMCKEVKSEKYVYGNPIPDFTFVFGEFHKELLTTKGGYPTDKVIVTGNPNLYDVIKIKQKLERKKILAKCNLPDKKIVLVPLSFRFMTYLNSPDRLLLNVLYKGLKNDSDIIILIRPHPGDSLDQTILDEFYPSPNFKLSPNSLFEDLFLSDVVVLLPLSTLAAEAVIFDKPILLTNLTKNKQSRVDPNFHYLVDHGVAEFSSIDEIVSKIKSIKKNQLSTNESSKKRNAFLESFFNLNKKVDLLEIIEKIKK